MKRKKAIRSISMKADLSKVAVHFDYALESAQDEENDDEVDKIIKTNIRPHKDFVDVMKKLRKLALDIISIKADAKEIGEYFVTELKIAGNMELHQSRVSMKVSRHIAKSGVKYALPIPQTEMFPEKENKKAYHKHEELATLVYEACKQAMLFIGGKYETSGQLPLEYDKD